MFSCTVPRGSLLFEHFIDIMGSWSTQERMKAHRKAMSDDPAVETMSDVVFAKIWSSERGAFVGFVLQAVGNIGTVGHNQLFYNTFCARFHGLSRQGVAILASHGYMLPITTYDRHEKKTLEKIDANFRCGSCFV